MTLLSLGYVAVLVSLSLTENVQVMEGFINRETSNAHRWNTLFVSISAPDANHTY